MPRVSSLVRGSVQVKKGSRAAYSIAKTYEDTTENFIVATVDVALAAQNAAVAAESLGLGIVYIGGIRNRSEEVAELLGLPYLAYPVFGMCLELPGSGAGFTAASSIAGRAALERL